MVDKTFKVAIIGGGASGLFCAIELLRGKDAISPNQIVIIEKNDRVGKKLLATGNGRCNLTNANINETHYHGDKRFISSFIKNYQSVNLNDYFKSVGIYTVEENEGKIYPLSKQASSVLDQIRSFLPENTVLTKTSFAVEKISFQNGVFVIESKNEKIKAYKLVFACGGKSGEGFMTDGSAYSLLDRFGHNVNKLSPSIVQIKTEREKIKGLKNIRENVRVSLIKNGKKQSEYAGDVIFTDYGVSGNAIFAISSYLSGGNEVLNFEFLPELTIQNVADIISKRKGMPFIKENGEFVGLVNKRVGYAVQKTAVSRDPEELAYALKHFTLKVEGTAGFALSQVTKGGFPSDKIDADTYESKNQKGLFVVGEALDVDGDCGGFNLTFAFVSGICAARKIKSDF
ncbi:MAG: aminoacetone oxidase family FAD-binding enzyme [Clostridia bacterium]|nr:aminoacetone oxidase family FAD-binding enzyme [Clostridia bacterium]